MKYTNFLLLLWLLGFAGVPDFQSQVNKEAINKTEKNTCTRDDYHGWTSVRYAYLTFCIPDTFKKVTDSCNERGCRRYEYRDVQVSLDLSQDSFRPTYEKYFPSYSQKLTTLSGRSAWLWHFTYEEDHKYISGVNIKPKETSTHYGIGLFLISGSNENRELAEKIFFSVSFDAVKSKP